MDGTVDMVWTTVKGTERELWDYVGRMESFDYATRLFEQFNGLVADREKIREINAAFAQGRMYFENARSANLGVKPLLLYYGAMTLAAGLVSFKQPEKAAGTLKPSHGLRADDWRKVLHSGVENVLDLEIKATGGTFRELAHVAWHWNVGKVYGNVQKRETYPEVRNLGFVHFADGKSSLALRDLISRSRYTGGDYAAITGEPSQLHRVVVQLTEGNRMLAVRSVDLVPKDTKVELSFPRDDPAVPLWVNNDLANEQTSMTMVDSFPNGDRLSEFIKLYLISYVLGMLSRYFPSRWMSLIRNDAGSAAQPLLAKSVRAVETKFVAEFAQQMSVIYDDPGFFGEHLGYLSQMFAHDWRNGWKEPKPGTQETGPVGGC